MTKLTRVLVKGTYALLGALFIAVGLIPLLINTGLLPDALREGLLDFARSNLGVLHVLQEFGSLLILAGLLTFWFLRHYDESRAFHWMLTAYWALMAVIHWFNVAVPGVSVVGGLINTIPFALFLVLGLLREATEGRPTTERTTVPEPAEQTALSQG